MASRHILLDPFVLAVPNAPDRAAPYLQGLIEWLPALAKRRNECSVLQQCIAILIEENRFPTHETVSHLLQHAGIAEYSVTDLRNLLRIVAETEPFFEHHAGFQAVTADRAAVEPAEAISRLGTRLGEVTTDAFTIAAFAVANGWCSDGFYVGTTEWMPRSHAVSISATVTLLERISGDLVAHDAVVADEFGVLRNSVAFDCLRSLSECYRDAAGAVQLVCQQLREAGCVDIPKDLVVTYGRSFLQSIEANNIHRQPAILETVFHRAVMAAAGALAGIGGAKLRPVRTGTAADAPQVVREDGAKLWRCTVTKRGAGYRLHYWNLPNDAIELEEVMVESKI